MTPVPDEPRRLTEREYWDAQYARQSPHTAPPPRHTGVKHFLKTVLGPAWLERMRDYRDYVLWDVIYRRYLGSARGRKALEVGSAPGTHLTRLRAAFGLDPYGVEYSDQGVELNRAEFRRHGIDTSHVIQADFFSPAFQQAYAGAFDLVVSHGFIEHFSDVRAVVAAHARLLAKGGLLIVTVPNLRGVNYGLQWWFNRAVLPLHNLTIMRRAAFAEVFTGQGLTQLQCGYYGTFSFGVFAVAHTSAVRRWSFWLCWKLQALLNVAFRSVNGARGADAGVASPYLIYVGRKPD